MVYGRVDLYGSDGIRADMSFCAEEWPYRIDESARERAAER